MKRVCALVLCLMSIFVSANAVSVESIDFEKASIEELEAFLSLMDDAKAALEEKKNSKTDEEMCEEAIQELKAFWAEEMDRDEYNGYFQVAHTRVFHLYTESQDELIAKHLCEYFTNDSGVPMKAFVECTLFTDYFGAAPYYENIQLSDCVAFYDDGTVMVMRKSPVALFRARAFVTDFEGIIRDIVDMGSQYNEICYLK